MSLLYLTYALVKGAFIQRGQLELCSFFFSLVTGSTLLASVEATNLSVKESFSTPHGVVVNVSSLNYSTWSISLTNFQLSWVHLTFRIKSLALPVFRFGNMCLSDKGLRYQTFSFRVLKQMTPRTLLPNAIVLPF